MNHDHSTDLPKPEIPARLKVRPLYRGIPIPANVFVDSKGVPDFRITDTNKQMKLVEKGKCALCGDRLSSTGMWFVGGPLCRKYLGFLDWAMHLDCLCYALKVCPFLCMRKDYSPIASSLERHREENATLITHDDTMQRPEKFFMFCAGRVEVRPYTEQQVVFVIVGNFQVYEVPNDIDQKTRFCNEMTLNLAHMCKS